MLKVIAEKIIVSMRLATNMGVFLEADIAIFRLGKEFPQRN